MGFLGVNKIGKLLPRRLHTKRAASFGVAAIMVFSILSYSFFFRSPKVEAISTVGSSSDSAASGNLGQRHEVVSSNGTIVAFFDSGTTSPTGIVYSTSTDGGNTWGSATQVDSDQSHDFSVTIDGSDNIYVAYSNGSATPSAYIRKMTYSAGSWSVGSANTIASSTSAACVGNVGDDYYGPSVAVNSAGNVYVALADKAYTGSGCSSSTLGTKSFYSSNLSSWTAYTSPTLTVGITSSYIQPSVVEFGNSVWVAITTRLIGSSTTGGLIMIYADPLGSGSWDGVAATSNIYGGGGINYVSGSGVSMLYSNGAIHFFYAISFPSAELLYRNYTISSATLSSTTVISSSANDVLGAISSDSQNLWVAYQSYVGAGSYNVVYERYNGTSWDGSPTAITTDNLNNTGVNLPEYMPGSANVPVTWNAGTSSPYTVKAATLSSVGTVTDTGNQTGSYSGTLTGNSGDIVVKCGVWYYNTVNIVSGMTIKVCASNGQVGGSLTIYANSVTVAGSIDGAGRGSPGGVGLSGWGGIGALGPAAGVAISGNPGTSGYSYTGGTGSGSYGGSNGSAGTSDSSPGAGGTNVGVNGGGGGGGSGATAGTSASNGGYLSAGGNGDSSTDFSLTLGSGGGGGGSGGSGSGAGSGSSSTNTCAAGGPGGGGANGGVGGLGGNGGAMVKIYSTGSITVSGSITTTGQAAGSAGGAINGTTGSPGGAGNAC